MPDRDSFIAAIAAAGADDLPRLVFADWLDENDQPDRAEFVRVQVALASVSSLESQKSDEFPRLYKRQMALLDEHARVWFGSFAASLGFDLAPARTWKPVGLLKRAAWRVGRMVGTVEKALDGFQVEYDSAQSFRTIRLPLGLPVRDAKCGVRGGLVHRGFVEHLSLMPRRLRPGWCAADAFRLEPVTSLTLEGAITADDWKRVDGEYLRQVSALSLVPKAWRFPERDGGAITGELYHSPHLIGVRELRLSEYDEHSTMLRDLVRSPLVGQLTALRINIHVEAIRYLNELPAEGPPLTLELCFTGPLNDLHRMPCHNRVEVLELGTLDCQLLGDVCPFHDGFWRGLRALRISLSCIPEDAFRRLCESTGLPALRELDMSSMMLDPWVIAAVADAPFLPQLEVLNLSRNTLTDQDVRAIVARIDQKRVQQLNLRENPLSQPMRDELTERFGDRVQLGELYDNSENQPRS